MQKQDEIGFVLFLKRIKINDVLNFIDYLPDDKTYHIILNYEYSSNVTYEDIKTHVEKIKKELNNEKTHITIMGSSIPNEYHNLLPSDGAIRDYENEFYIKYKQVIAETDCYDVSFGDYC